MAKVQIDYIWKDRKRFMGMPLSFTRYMLADDRIFVQTGLFSTKYEELLLYRVKDISLSRTLWQKMFGMGTVTVQSSDTTTPVLAIKNIKKSFEVKELIHSCVEDQKIERRYRINEIVDDGGDDSDGDGIPDLYDEE